MARFKYQALGIFGKEIVGFTKVAQCKAFCMRPEQMFTPDRLTSEAEALEKLAQRAGCKNGSVAEVWEAACKAAVPSVYDDPSRYRAKDKQRPTKVYYLRGDIASSEYSHLTPQAQTIMDHLCRAPDGAWTTDEMEEFMYDLHQQGHLTTKQNPYRVFLYYLPKLRACGFIKEGYQTK